MSREFLIKSCCLRTFQRELDRVSKRLRKLRTKHPVCPSCASDLAYAQEIVDSLWEAIQFRREAGR
jgi:hypothetical protein